jgi:hypothetical protein
MTVELLNPDGSTPGVNCDDETRAEPCRVAVNLHHDFRLIVPLSLDVFGLHIGFPSTLSFDRKSIFAISDFEIDAP